MHSVFRGIAAGVLIGTALFFVPFLFGFFFFILFVFIISRLLRGPRRYGRGWREGYHGRPMFVHPGDDYYGNGIVSIDGRRYSAPINRQSPERHFPIG